MEIVLASSNKHKVIEINDIISTLDLNIKFILPPDGFDPIENGKNFEENSYIKAMAAYNLSKQWVLADDSGLCIDALDGRPGIYSARYAETPQLRIEKVLNELSGINNRTAHFACAMTLLNPKGEIAYKALGICQGTIIYNPKGKNGFGYDPIFLPNGSNKTMAELTEQEKNKISHRAIALNKIINFLKKINTNN